MFRGFLSASLGGQIMFLSAFYDARSSVAGGLGTPHLKPLTGTDLGVRSRALNPNSQTGPILGGQVNIEPGPARDIDCIHRKLAGHRALELNRRSVENQTTGTRKRHRAASLLAPYPAGLREYVCLQFAAQ